MPDEEVIPTAKLEAFSPRLLGNGDMALSMNEGG
jgi:hypothetical protein